MHQENVRHILLRINWGRKCKKMIRLRELKEKDASLMLEWMHDIDIQKSFKKRMLDTTIEDAKRFVKEAQLDEELVSGMSLHFAIVDIDDEYLGTVSLKNIDFENRTAEYAIISRKKAHGLGVAFKATGLVLDKAFGDLGLQRIYLSVYSNNEAAIKLYEKCGFKYEGEFRNHFIIDDLYVGWKWYGMLKDEFNRNMFLEE